MAEIDVARNTLYRQLMAVPHRNLGPPVRAFGEAMVQDPLFTSCMCVYLNLPRTEQKVRDIQDAAIIALLQADPRQFSEFREAGRCLWAGEDIYPGCGAVGLPPFRMLRVDEYMDSRFMVMHSGAVLGRTVQCAEIARFSSPKEAEKAKLGLARQIALREMGESGGRGKTKEAGRLVAERAAQIVGGLVIQADAQHKKAPRTMERLVCDWFAMLERDPWRQDGVVLLNRKALRRTWWRHRGRLAVHSRKYPRLYALLFGKAADMPQDSRIYLLKQIVRLQEAGEAAQAVRMAIEHRIPFKVATSVLGKLTPVVGVALFRLMSPTEALNSIRWVEASGLLEHEELRAMFEEKVKRASATASVASMDHRRSAQATDERLKAIVQEAKEMAVQTGGRIVRDTDVYTDASGSQELSIKFGIEFASRIAALCDAEKRLVFFKQYAKLIEPREWSLAGIRDATRVIRAGGRTSMVAALRTSQEHGGPGQQIVLITDGGENVGNFAQALAQLPDPPHVIMIKLPGDRDVLSPRLERAGLSLDRFECDGRDYYVFDAVMPMLVGPKRKTLVDAILETVLPRRVR